jgi:hypothetical protein
MISGTLGSTAITDGHLRGDQIEFTAGGQKYTGRVEGMSMKGTAGSTSWAATKK